MSYHIKPGYVEQAIPNGVAYFLDDPKPAPDGGTITFQPDVYLLAEYLAERQDGWPKIVDVGCGYGDKLAAIHDLHPTWEYVGVDLAGPNLRHCIETYPWGEWRPVDLERVAPDGLYSPDAIVVASDVIEHLADPDPLAAALARSEASTIIVSTPERDVQHGYDHNGPSPNLCHVREWNAAELHSYLSASGLRIRWHGMTRGSDLGWAMATQIIVAEPGR